MAAGQAHLTARPTPVTSPAPVGLQQLHFGGERDSYLFVPPSYDVAEPSPLVLLLHGAGGHAHDGIRVLLHLAERAGLILLAPASHDTTWDIITNRAYGPDRDLADRALAYVFARYAVDPMHLAIGGFSDGASYALSLGLANGDLFSHILAFSPGFIGPGRPRGNPSIFISHGIEDSVLPINACGRTIVRQLRAAQYTVLYDEFDGGHVIPPEIAWRAADWFLDRAI
ncbi:alpha/beta hydrolase [Massilia horti]|uniref:Phospholipase n=1 Tax=Massilia horti TaxID=2562153 RepID=A0A4Y9SUU0_9BURK|nr:alpha/beta hydrolase-fold protein [Massilia horti]TFW28974.1 phospholipase [Massilia horti]